MTKDNLDNSNNDKSHGDSSWFERNASLITWAVALICVGTLVAELVCRPYFDDHHPAHFEIENIFGYQAAIGFAAFVVVVFLGKFLRLIIRRPEDYYDQ